MVDIKFIKEVNHIKYPMVVWNGNQDQYEYRIVVDYDGPIRVDTLEIRGDNNAMGEKTWQKSTSVPYAIVKGLVDQIKLLNPKFFNHK